MLPEEVKRNSTIKRYLVLPRDETDARHVLEAWEREPHPDDKEPQGQLPGEYHCKWVDRTAVYKAEWKVLMAKDEMERLRREEIRKARESDVGHGVLDSVRKMR